MDQVDGNEFRSQGTRFICKNIRPYPVIVDHHYCNTVCAGTNHCHRRRGSD